MEHVLYNDIVIIHEISVFDVLICLLAVVTMFFGRYNKESNKTEAEKGQKYSFKKFFAFFSFDLLYWLFAGMLVLTFVNEIAGPAVAQMWPQMDAEWVGSLNYTLSAASGIFGYKLVNKFI